MNIHETWPTTTWTQVQVVYIYKLKSIRSDITYGCHTRNSVLLQVPSPTSGRTECSFISFWVWWWSSSWFLWKHSFLESFRFFEKTSRKLFCDQNLLSALPWQKDVGSVDEKRTISENLQFPFTAFSSSSFDVPKWNIASDQKIFSAKTRTDRSIFLWRDLRTPWCSRWSVLFTKNCQQVREGRFEPLGEIERHLLKRTPLGDAKDFLLESKCEKELKQLFREARTFYLTIITNLVHYFHFDDPDVLHLWKCLSALLFSSRKSVNHTSSIRKFEGLMQLLHDSGCLEQHERHLSRDEFVRFLTDSDVSGKLEEKAISVSDTSPCSSQSLRIDHFFRDVSDMSVSLPFQMCFWTAVHSAAFSWCWEELLRQQSSADEWKKSHVPGQFTKRPQKDIWPSQTWWWLHKNGHPR